jgi:hypothetical protein
MVSAMPRGREDFKGDAVFFFRGALCDFNMR